MQVSNQASLCYELVRQDLRMVLGLDTTLAVNLILDAFPVKTFLNLLHGSQVQDGAVSHNHDLLGSHVFEVHANLLGTAGSKANARCCHLKSILFLLRVVDRCRKSTSSLGDAQRIVMVSWVAVAWASWTVSTHCTQEIESSYCSAWCYAYGCHCDRYGSRKKMQEEEPKASGGYVLTFIIGSWLWGQRVLRGSVSLRGSNRFGIPLSRWCLWDKVELTILEPSRYRQRELYKCYDQIILVILFHHSSCCSSNICSSEAEAEAYPTIFTLETSSLETQSALRCRRSVYLLVSEIDICERVYDCERQSYSAV
jgi:hypothetical protein